MSGIYSYLHLLNASEWVAAETEIQNSSHHIPFQFATKWWRPSAFCRQLRNLQTSNWNIIFCWGIGSAEDTNCLQYWCRNNVQLLRKGSLGEWRMEIIVAETCVMKAVEIGSVPKYSWNNKTTQHDCLNICPWQSNYEQALFLLLKALVYFLEERQAEGETSVHVLCAHKYNFIILLSNFSCLPLRNSWWRFHVGLLQASVSQRSLSQATKEGGLWKCRQKYCVIRNDYALSY